MKQGLIGVLIVALALSSTYLWLQDYLATPLKIAPDGYTLIIERGNSLRGVAKQLARHDVLQSPAIFAGYGRISGLAGRIQAGEYVLETGTTPGSLLDTLVKGRVKLHSITIIEGWTVAELLEALANHPAISHTLELNSLVDLNNILGLDYPHPEGLFFPDTYHFPRGTTDVELLRQSHELLIERLNLAWSGREPHTVLGNPYEGLILASIVERETALSAERSQVAGVFIRRLEQGMRLQTDPTVIYGLGESFDGNLTHHHLKTDSPYNTYVRRGLPPTPIALPGESALQAMAHPAPGGALYFVATGNGDGSHYFTATLEEHNAAVARYLAMLKQQRGQGTLR
ncbi:MAG: endolytic transglycosylase MltG [Gammaproteobacteria bacterium]|nr:aminodeoxychorismate lyase [Chromatiales bacterium]MDP6675090.1 endolytic transglycosylase MltG [Gammaproteobacteria bacterium]